MGLVVTPVLVEGALLVARLAQGHFPPVRRMEVRQRGLGRTLWRRLLSSPHYSLPCSPYELQHDSNITNNVALFHALVSSIPLLDLLPLDHVSSRTSTGFVVHRAICTYKRIFYETQPTLQITGIGKTHNRSYSSSGLPWVVGVMDEEPSTH